MAKIGWFSCPCNELFFGRPHLEEHMDSCASAAAMSKPPAGEQEALARQEQERAAAAAQQQQEQAALARQEQERAAAAAQQQQEQAVLARQERERAAAATQQQQQAAAPSTAAPTAVDPFADVLEMCQASVPEELPELKRLIATNQFSPAQLSLLLIGWMNKKAKEQAEGSQRNH